MDKSSGAPELHFFCLTLALHIAWAFIEACSVDLIGANCWKILLVSGILAPRAFNVFVFPFFRVIPRGGL